MCLGKAMGVTKTPEKEKKTSLLKPYTNFEKIKAMDIDEMAEFLSDCETDICSFCKPDVTTVCGNPTCCINGIKNYLESEAE